MVSQDAEFEAVRQLAPWDPYAWGGLLSALLLIYLTARCGTGLAIAAARWPLRRRQEAAWTERARIAWPSRDLGAAAFGILGGLCVFISFIPKADSPLLPRTVLTTLAITGGLLGVIQSVIAGEQRLNPAYALTPRATRGAWILRLATLGPILLLLLLGAVVLPDRMNLAAAVVLVLIALLTGFYLGWGWAVVMRASGLLRPASERLRRIVSSLGEQATQRVRRVEQAALPMANAFALPLDGGLAMTDAALAVLDDDEARAICAHELAHLGEPRRFVWLRVSRGFVLGVFLALVAASIRPLTGSFGFVGLLLGVAAAFGFLIASARLLNHFHRKLEHRADAEAVGYEASPGLYARALEKIHEANLVPAVMRSKRTTHPDLFDRMIQAGLTPAYPRPAPAPRWPGWIGLAVLFFVAGLGMLAYVLLLDVLPDALFDPASAALWKIGAKL